jgi:abhydrolase domain-containing protein 6
MTKNRKKIFLLVPLVILLVLAGVYFLFPGAMFDLARKVERRAGNLEQRSIDVEGLRIEYLEGGKGDPLVLLHGFGANKDNWTRIGKYLTPHFRVIAPDLPGFGESSPDPGGDYRIRIQAQRVKALVRALGIKSFHLGGNSMGGNIAGVYASIYPTDLKSLLLIDPGGVASSEPSEMSRRLKDGAPNPLIAENVRDYDRLLDFVFVKRPFIPRPIKRVLIQEAIEHQPLNRKIFQQLQSSVDVEPLEVLLKDMPVPTLIVWGRQDRVLHVSGAKILASVMPNAKAELMDSVGHLPMIEKPEETARLYLSFLGLKKLGMRDAQVSPSRET